MVRFTCPTCQTTLQAPDEKAGAAVACPQCKGQALVPSSASATAPIPVVQWYYSRGGNRQGPITNVGLKQLAESGKLQPTDLVWKDGMAKWRPAFEVKGLFAAEKAVVPPPLSPVAAPPSPAEDVQWHYTRNGQRFGPVSVTQLTALMTSGELQRTDWVWNNGMVEWVAVSSVKELAEVKVEGVASGPVKELAAAKPAGPLGFFGGLAQQALKNVQEAGAKIKDAAQRQHTPEKPQPPALGLVAPPPAKVEGVASGSMNELAAAKPGGPLGFFGGLAQNALKNVQETRAKIKDAAQRQPAPEKPQPPALGLVPPPPRPLPAQERVDPQTVQKAVPEVAGPSPQPAVAQTTAIAEVTATYQGGHPEFVEKVRGVLRLNDVGLELEIKDSERRLRIAYDQLTNILEPQKGDFPDEMVNTASQRKTAASAVTGFLGLVAKVSGNDTVKMAAGVGKTVANTVKEVSKLGPPPKNRLNVLVFVGGVKHKLSFDVVGDSTAKMEEGARGFWNLSAQVRSRFAKAGGAFSSEDALEQLKGLLDQGILTREQFDQQSSGMGKAAGLSADGHEPSARFSSFSTGPPQQLLRILEQLKALTDQGTFTQSEFEELKAIILPKLQAGPNRKRDTSRGASDSPADEREDDSITDDIDGGSDFDADEMADLANGHEDVEQEDAGDESDGNEEEVEEVTTADDLDDYWASSDADDE